MEEKMAALREASKAYIKNRKIDPNTLKSPTTQFTQDVNIESESTDDDDDDDYGEKESVPDLVDINSTNFNSSSELRASSMWHMTPITADNYNPNHPTTLSKRIKYNFSSSWRVSKLE